MGNEFTKKDGNPEAPELGEQPKVDVPPSGLEPSPLTAPGPAEGQTTSPPARTPATLKAYARDARAFESWCAGAGRTSLPSSSETALLYLEGLVRAGRRRKGCTRVGTSIAHAHREAGLPVPWPCESSAEIVRELRKRVSGAFADESPAESQGEREEREAVVQLFTWLQVQMPRCRRSFAFLGTFVEGGHHLRAPDATIDDRFHDRGDGPEASTLCELSGCVLVRGRHATDAECRAHRCP